MLRLFCGTLVLLLFPACATETANTAPAATPPPANQILWQRTLDDALAIAKLRHQPLLLAINMDGESASDRIYSERYRDPEFVAATHHCVCLGASVFRHNARDYDEQVRRIPCPRFGEITCGEHMALEPVLFEKYLADGDRVAPRHALILPDGKKAWDLSLCFDLKDVDRALFASVQGAGKANGEPVACEHRQRLQFEDAFGDVQLEELGRHGDPSAADALRRLVPMFGWASLWTFPRPTCEAFTAAVLSCGLAAPIGQELWLRLQVAATDSPGWWFEIFEQLAAKEPSLQLQLRAHRALSSRGAPSLASLLAQAAEVTQSLAGSPPAVRPTGDEMPEASVLERELEDVEKLLAKNADDAALHARFAKASLDLGRQHIDAGKKDAQLLLVDAATHFKKAIERDARRYEWFVESARTAYFLGDFAGEVAFGRRALALATGKPLGELPVDAARLDAQTAEALRWIGDGIARRLADPAGQDEATMREGVQALGLVAASSFSGVNDWVGLASFCGALWCWRAQLQAAEAGALRLPAATEIRGCITQALWNSGRIADAPAVAARIAEGAPVAESAWFTGQAWTFVAEDCRRRDDTRGALAAYASAAQQFVTAAKRNSSFTNDCKLRTAAVRCGVGMALVRTNDRADAADAFVAAIELHADVKTQRDGLGYDAFDLVDRLLEWRESGPSPVTATALDERLRQIAPDEVFWPTAVADAAIREALRADGRNPQRVEKMTVDAGGKPVRAMMGLPTELGDAWLREAMAIGRRAVPLAAGEAAADAKTTLAQACTLWAERQLERESLDGVEAALREAATVLGSPPPAADAGKQALAATAAALREQLGPARPRLREGR